MRRKGRIVGAVLLAGLCGCARTMKTEFVASIPNREFRINQEEVILFADSSIPITDDQVASFKLLTGKVPAFWGRYVCNPYAQGGHNIVPQELAIFAKYKISPILIIEPRQGDLARGADEARTEETCVANRLGELKALPNGGVFASDTMVFLAVEKGSVLSEVYLREMIQALRRDNIISDAALFGVYLHGVDSAQVRGVINNAIAASMPISVAWFARYQPNEYCGALSYWQENNIAEFGIVNVPIEMLQYAGDCRAYGGRYPQTEFDLDVVRPPFYDRASRGALVQLID